VVGFPDFEFAEVESRLGVVAAPANFVVSFCSANWQCSDHPCRTPLLPDCRHRRTNVFLSPSAATLCPMDWRAIDELSLAEIDELALGEQPLSRSPEGDVRLE
jgi:hypothetical protein